MTAIAERYMPLRTVSVRRVADRIVTARLEAEDGHALPSWEPGAHVEIQLPSGLVRHYSLCGDPSDARGYDIAVLREQDGRGGSEEFHQGAAPGWVIGVGAPRNDFPLEPAEDYLFLAGGVGITPILPMVRYAIASGASWRLVYAGRSRTSMAFLDDVVALDADRVTIVAEDEVGRPDIAAELATTGPATRVYTCGPSPMLDAIVDIHAAREVAAPLHLERFSGEASADVTGQPFEVVAKRSGVVVMIGADQTILGTLRKEIPGLPFSCEEGYCGTCETDVLEGVPDHRDTYLDDDEREDGDTMMICVSRCTGPRLVLDI